MINDYEATRPITTDATVAVPSNEDVITTLNGLIETCKDGQEGFRSSSDAVKDANLQAVFSEYSIQRERFAEELRGLVSSLGGDPENSGTLAGTLHRGWLNLKATVTGGDDAAILNECERGEDVAKNAYQTALKENLPTDINEVIRMQYNAVISAHDKIKALRDSANEMSKSSSA